jgi:tetratricopeptide (TPR) repeat protein
MAGALPILAAGRAAASFPVSGELVDADVPATYRLPRVAPATASMDVAVAPLFFPPRAAAAGPTAVRVAKPANIAQPEIVVAAGEQLAPPVAAVAPAADRLTVQLLPAVQRGFRLAQRGALYAAREEFIQVLRRVAQSRDAVAKTDERSRALAAGLRALDEAEDFVPQGTELEAELDVRRVASSHRTRVLPPGPEKVLPVDAVRLYHEYAREQLAKAAAGERAGSMALHGVGRIYARLAELGDDDDRLLRWAMTTYSAALEACPDNHLAANELGVLVCRDGRPGEAVRLFERAIDFAPSATAYHNLAAAQQRLGMYAQAEANERESQRLAAAERASGAISRRAGIEWVSPAEMARVVQPGTIR